MENKNGKTFFWMGITGLVVWLIMRRKPVQNTPIPLSIYNNNADFWYQVMDDQETELANGYCDNLPVTVDLRSPRSYRVNITMPS